MNLQKRVELLQTLKNYLADDGEEWKKIKTKAMAANAWFTPGFIDLAVKNICTGFLEKEKLEQWTAHYHLDDNIGGKNIGIVMAGNIPLVGFHDFLCVFISGHRQTIRLSSKDDVLLKHLAEKLTGREPAAKDYIQFADLLKGCDGYIATGSNNSARYFEQYFSRYPHIIRRNRTSVAVLDGDESAEELDALSDDIHQFFGLGCRNVTKIYIPAGYDFIPLLNAFNRYRYFIDHHKYKNNYDYQLSIALLNNVHYMTNGSTLMIGNESLFSPISQLNYSYYTDKERVLKDLAGNEDVQCITGHDGIAFGKAQSPGLTDYADGVDTLQFLLTL